MKARTQLLPVNQVEHSYRGGDRITALRGGSGAGGPRRPEEWIASMTTMTSDPARGLSRLPEGTLLRDAVMADPQSWLGPAHVDSYGASTELLVKLLDAGQRLPVHLHPDRAFSRKHLGIPHGKTEAWIVLDVDEGARVRLGFAESMRLSQVRAMVDAGDSDGLVGSLRAHAVRPGDAVLVPAGLPHSIDAGVFVLELQEPTDLSIMLEAEGLTLDLRRDGHLGLGFDIALGALHLGALNESDLDGLLLPRERLDTAGIVGLLPVAAEPYFRAHRLRAVGTSPVVAAGFAVALVTTGSGRLVTESGERLDLSRGEVAVVPFLAGEWQLEGMAEAIVCRPPLPQHKGTAP
jgi:mannose-6-phosphate isomerase